MSLFGGLFRCTSTTNSMSIRDARGSIFLLRGGAGRGGAGDIFFSEGILYFIVYIQCCVGCAAVDDIVV